MLDCFYVTKSDKDGLKVIVTFLEEIQEDRDELIDLKKFSFLKSQKVLKDFKGSLSDTVIAERRIEL